MGRHAKERLRALTNDERWYLEQMSRASSAPAAQVVRAKLLLQVASGVGYGAAAKVEGRRSGAAVGQLVRRFNRAGIEALEARHGGGPRQVYGAPERARILAEMQRQPDRERDGTATWSLSTLQRALRCAPDGLPTVSHETILNTLHDGSWSWQKDRSWCQTGTVLRKRKVGIVEVTDPNTEEKKR
jgi:transposase